MKILYIWSFQIDDEDDAFIPYWYRFNQILLGDKL